MCYNEIEASSLLNSNFVLIASHLLVLIILFAILGWAAERAVQNIKLLAAAFRIRLFFFGIVLGLITTLPELAVGISAQMRGVADLSAGNLVGGLLVILGLILGASLIFNRRVKTDGRWRVIGPAAAFLILPVLLGVDGTYSRLDGLAMALLYLALFLYLFRAQPGKPRAGQANHRNLWTAGGQALAGIAVVLYASHFIVEAALFLLQQINMGPLAMGVVFFAIGTNLPEITIALASWRKKAGELSVNHLLSSAFSNVMILGFLSTLSPIAMQKTAPFWLIMVFLPMILILLIIFYISGRVLDRREGCILLAAYLLFLFLNFVL